MHASAALLLVVAGMAKLVRPDDGLAGAVGSRRRWLTRGCLAPPRLRPARARCGSAGRCWLRPSGLLYVGFALVVARKLLAGAESCGCFGRFDTPPSVVHVGANLALAAVSFAAIGADSSPVGCSGGKNLLATARSRAAALAVEIVVLAGLGFIALTALPEALATARTRQSSVVDISLDTARRRTSAVPVTRPAPVEPTAKSAVPR